MKLSIGIVGLPNVGKSTLFKALTKLPVNIANYPFCTIDPNVGVVSVPDERLQRLAIMSKSKKVIPAVIEFYDIAGLVRDAHKGEGLGNQFLSHIRETNAIAMVLRVFGGSEIVHVENSVDPMRDMEIINAELALKDLETIKKALKRLEGEARSGKKEAIKDLEVTRAAKTALERNESLWLPKYANIQSNPTIHGLQLLLIKPQLYILNGREDDVPRALIEKIKTLGANCVVADLKSENENAVNDFVQKAYAALNLISFFTTGEDETRAWTIENGTKAPQAAGVIHTDFEKKFIRAETIHSSKLLEAGSWATARQKGWLRLEGKEYIVQDGDVMEIRHG